MTQFVTRVDDRFARAVATPIATLIDTGVFGSRSIAALADC